MGLAKSIRPLLVLLIGLNAAGVHGMPYDDHKTVTPFCLTAIDDTQMRLDEDSGAEFTVVCFLGTQCPLAKLYGPRLQQLQDEFQSKNVRFVGVGSNLQDSLVDLREFAATHELAFPVAKDFDNIVADQFEAKRTPEVFVIDRQLRVRYRGRIDDQYLPGIVRPQANREDLRIALDELLAGKPVSIAVTDVEGCLIGRVKPTTPLSASTAVTYAGQIAGVLQRHCIECHRPGEIGPFSLTQYDEAIGWAEMIVEVVDEGRMPPWHAADSHRELSNQRIMPESDKQLLRDWLAAGTPHGDRAQMPRPRKFVKGWRLPKTPDLVVEMSDRPFIVPAQGSVEYQYFVVDPGFQQDQWISAAQVVPGNRSVVHHSIVFVRPPDGTQFRGIGWIGAYVPGQGGVEFIPGHARRIPAGSKLVFQQHYTPVGTEQADITKVGLVFTQADQVTHELLTLVGIDQDFEIPPRTSDHRVELRVSWLPRHGQLLSVAPHMHWRGKSFALFASSGSSRQQLLSVPRYDFNWQHNYQFKPPIALDAIDSLDATIVFDNSADNPSNPDPDEFVMWGDQTWEEMAVAFFGVAIPLKPPTSESGTVGQSAAALATGDQQLDSTAAQLAEQFLQRFDQNGDGIVTREETPRAVQRFGFWRIDVNQDNQLTRAEIERHATWSLQTKK